MFRICASDDALEDLARVHVALCPVLEVWSTDVALLHVPAAFRSSRSSAIVVIIVVEVVVN